MVTTNAKPKCPRWIEKREWGTRGPLWGLGAMGSREWGKDFYLSWCTPFMMATSLIQVAFIDLT